MTIRAGQLALWDRVMTREVELAAHIIVTLEANGLGCPGRLLGDAAGETRGLRTAGSEAERRLGFTAGLRVRAAGAVTRLAAGIDRIRPLGDQPRVIGCGEITIDFVVALLAFL